MNKPCSKCKYAVKLDSRSYSCDIFHQDKCEKIMKYRRYLKSRRKYRPGELIVSLNTLMKQTFVYWHGKITHISVIKNQQYNVIMRGLEQGMFYKAIKKESEV